MFINTFFADVQKYVLLHFNYAELLNLCQINLNYHLSCRAKNPSNENQPR